MSSPPASGPDGPSGLARPLLPQGSLLRGTTAFFTFTTSGFTDVVRNLHASLVRSDPELARALVVFCPDRSTAEGFLEHGVTAVSCDLTGLPDETQWESAGFGKVVAYKYLLARDLLKEARYVWWCDGDIVVTEPIVDRVLGRMLRDECDILTQYERPKDVHNTGFWIVRSGAPVDRMLSEVADHAIRNDADDQEFFNRTQTGRRDLRIAALDHDEFACGNRFYYRSLLRTPTAPMMHFNYYVGREAKRTLMLEHGQWHLGAAWDDRARARLRYQWRALRRKAGVVRRSEPARRLGRLRDHGLRKR